MFLFHEHGVEGKLLHCPLPKPHPCEMGVSSLLPLGHSGAHWVSQTSCLHPKYSVRVKRVKSTPRVLAPNPQSYHFLAASQERLYNKSWYRCIWNAANTSWLMWYYYYASIHPFLKSINRQSASCVPGPVVGPTFYTDFTLVWGDNVKNGNVLKTIPDHYMCQGCHRCDEKQVNGNYRE